MKKIALACLLAAASLAIGGPAFAKAAKIADPGMTPVSAADEAAFTAFKKGMNAAIVAKSGWNDPEYYYYDKAQHTATTAIHNTNNQVFQEQSGEARRIAERMCGRMGGCADVVFTAPLAAARR